MVGRWQYSGRSLYGLLSAMAVLSLAVTLRPAATVAARRPDRGAKEAGAGSPPANPAPAAGAPDWQALLQRVESLDTTKPEAAAALKAIVADLVRLHEAQAKELDALRAEVQALRSAPAAAASSRSGHSAGRSSPPTPAANAKPDAAATASTNLFGKVGLKKLHKAGCVFGERIKESDRVYFKTVEEAARAGYEPCKVCKPGG